MRETSEDRDASSDHRPTGYAVLLDQMSEILRDGDRQQLDSFLEANPRESDKLRQMIPTVRALAAIAAPSATPWPQASVNEVVPAPRILGDFHILKEIGRGGMGVVYEAQQISMGRTVALKVLPFAAVMDEKAITRFKNEARAAGILHHDNIVPVHAVGNERGVYYYAMALIEGLTLAEIIREQRRRVLDKFPKDLLLDQVVLARSDAAPQVAQARRTTEPRRPNPIMRRCASFKVQFRHTSRCSVQVSTNKSFGLESRRQTHSIMLTNTASCTATSNPAI